MKSVHCGRAALLGGIVGGCKARLPGHNCIQGCHDCQRLCQGSKSLLCMLSCTAQAFAVVLSLF